jgi:Trypsin-like peptidase domain
MMTLFPRASLRTLNGRAFTLLLFILLSALPLCARVGVAPLSQRRVVQAAATVQRMVLPPTDALAERNADAQSGVTIPLRYAVPSPVNLTPATHGTWEQVPGGRLWRLRIHSAGATDLNFGFSKFLLPEGATLHLCAEEENYFQGPYAARDNKPHGELWTPVVPGDSACLEMFVPDGAKEEPQLVISQVSRGYRDMFHRRKNGFVPAAGACEIDVVCPVASAWSNEIRSVARYSVSGTSLCSGTLINDAAGDQKNYFLTANHCGISAGNAASVVVYWNYQSPVCGQLGGGSLAQNQSGVIFRAAKADVDFALVELEDVPESSFNVYYSGWDRTTVASQGAVGIHHPNGDEKAISFSSTTLTTVGSCIAATSSTHWQVIWSSGVTEPGSSGSGIWNPLTHRLVGMLSGGDSFCDTPAGPDCYGKFSLAWDSGSSAASRLRDWLDPQNTGITSVPGMNPGVVRIEPVGFTLLTESCAPTNRAIDPGESVTLNLTLRNAGSGTTTNLVATLLATGGVSSPGGPQSYGALGGASVSRPFSLIATGACGGTVTATLLLQDGLNNLGTVTYSLLLGRPVTLLVENFDGVAAPALPAGWTTSASGVATPWSTTATQRDTVPNAAFAADPADISDNQLISPAFSITSTNAQLTFRHSYDFELAREPFDGGVLEISLNGSAFTDLITAGGAFQTNGYNGVVSVLYQNPLAGRSAWTGNSAGFVTTRTTLPTSAAGSSVRLKWRVGTDTTVAATGWYVDTLSISDGFECCPGLVPPLIVNPRRAGTNLAFSFNSLPGQSYVVEANTNLTNHLWLPLRTNAGNGVLQSYTNDAQGLPQRFFRVRTQ